MARINRELAKKDFLKSKYITIVDRAKPYFKKAGHSPGQDRIEKKTIGRGKEKQRLLALATDKAQEEIINETVKELKEIYKPSAEELGEMHKAIFNIMKVGINKLSQEATKKDKNGKPVGSVNTKELKDYWEMMKAEKMEPTKVNKLNADDMDSSSAVIIISPKVGGVIDGM